MMRRSFSQALLGALLQGVFFISWANSGEIRTPARQYGSAYSIKLEMVHQGFTYVVPVWVRPDQKDSTLDPGQLSFLGWVDRDFSTEDLILSGEHLGKFKMKPGKSDWAVRPEYPKNCCMGVLGQDFLSQFRLRFDPIRPANIEWTRVENSSAHPVQVEREFESRLKPLFSVQTDVVRVGEHRYDLANTPFLLDLQHQKLEFEREPLKSHADQSTLGTPIFSFVFQGPSRELLLLDLRTPSVAGARRFGLARGAQILELNGKAVSGMSRFEIEAILKGAKGESVEIAYLKKPGQEEKSKVDFDFKKNEFTEPRTLSSPPRRN